MKTVIAVFFFVVIVCVHGSNWFSNMQKLARLSLREIMVEDDDGNLVKVDITAMDNEDIEETRKDLVNKVQFHLHTQNNPTKQEAQQLFVGDTDRLHQSFFDPRRPTRFVVHGWMNSAKSDASCLIHQAYLEQGDYNVIVVDWSSASLKNYLFAKNRVKIIAEYVGHMIDFLVKCGMNPAETHLVGHSLGAHIVGIGAWKANCTIGYVIGLDPALPLYYFAKPEERISRGDAAYVQIIHTDAGALGISDAIGDVDFYPNDGTHQPGCLFDLTGACSHAQAYRLFAQSITNTGGFVGTKCRSYRMYRWGLCNGNHRVIMGGPEPTTSATGVYYVDTTEFTLYAEGN